MPPMVNLGILVRFSIPLLAFLFVTSGARSAKLSKAGLGRQGFNSAATG